MLYIHTSRSFIISRFYNMHSEEYTVDMIRLMKNTKYFITNNQKKKSTNKVWWKFSILWKCKVRKKLTKGKQAIVVHFWPLKCLIEHSMELHLQPLSPSLTPSLCEMTLLLHSQYEILPNCRGEGTRCSSENNCYKFTEKMFGDIYV